MEPYFVWVVDVCGRICCLVIVNDLLRIFLRNKKKERFGFLGKVKVLYTSARPQDSSYVMDAVYVSDGIAPHVIDSAIHRPATLLEVKAKRPIPVPSV